MQLNARTVKLDQFHSEAAKLKLPSTNILFPTFHGDTADISGIFESRFSLNEVTAHQRSSKRLGFFYDPLYMRSPLVVRPPAGFSQSAAEHHEHPEGATAYGRVMQVTATIKEFPFTWAEVAPPERQFCANIDGFAPPMLLEPYCPRGDLIFTLLSKLTV